MKILILNLLLWAVASATYAQELAPAKPTNNFAHWVIESNVKTPKNSVVKFYNSNQELVYQEEINGRRLDVRRAKIVNNLNQVLGQLMEKKNSFNEDNLVAISFQRK